MQSIFNLSLIALFSFATVIAGTKEEIINKKLLLDAKKHNIISNNNELIPVSKFRSNSDNRYDCTSCAYDFTQYGAECCDAAWELYGLDCATLQSDYNWDCTGCECAGDGEAECGDGTCTGGETNETCPEDCDAPPAPGDECFCGDADSDGVDDCDGYVLDCSLGYCFDPQDIGDGQCDDFCNNIGLNCEEFSFDGGDCDGVEINCTPGMDCGGCGDADSDGVDDCDGWVFDCSLVYCVDPASQGDGICDDPYLSCEEFSYDDGDCYVESPANLSAAGETDDYDEDGVDDYAITWTWDHVDYATILDCDGDEVPDWWVSYLGDGYCDLLFNCEDYSLDGGDCADCGNGMCDSTEDYTNCPDDCALPDCETTFTVAGEADLDDDGVMDACYTDGSGYFSFTWEGGCQATTVTYSSGTLDVTSYNFTSGFYFTGFDPGVTENFELTFDTGGVATGSATAACGGAPECGDTYCNGDETEASCPADCSGCQGYVDYIGDGDCDASNNNSECQWDGGDCCPGDCAEVVANDCPDNPTGCYGTDPGSLCGICEECNDPTSADNMEGGECYGRYDGISDQSDNKVADGLSLRNASKFDSKAVSKFALINNQKGSAKNSRYDYITFDISVSWEGGGQTWSTSFNEMTIYGFTLDEISCATVVAVGNDGAVSDPTDEACASAGAPLCTLGDANGDNSISILDLVVIVQLILTQDTDIADHPCADYNDDGTITILDLVSIVSYILDGNGREIDATSATMKIDDGSLSIVANGSVDGIQMTLSHGADFAIDLMDNALLAEYKTTGNQTILIVLRPEGEEIFTSQGDFEVVEVIAANSSGMVDVAITPTEFALSSAYPNPFNPTTSLELSVPANGQVTVQVYNLMGQVVSTLANGYMDANTYTLTWDASNVSSGMYIVKAEAAGTVSTQKLMLMK